MTKWNKSAADGYSVYVNGYRLEFDQQPINIEGYTLVPLRGIFEALGAAVTWDSATNTAIAVKNGVTVSVQTDSAVLYRNGKPIMLDVPAQLIGGRTLVPVRAISEAFGAAVDWDADSLTVTITY